MNNIIRFLLKVIKYLSIKSYELSINNCCLMGVFEPELPDFLKEPGKNDNSD
jgi:cyclic lactone autoinducer peptide